VAEGGEQGQFGDGGLELQETAEDQAASWATGVCWGHGCGDRVAAKSASWQGSCCCSYLVGFG